jgi:hypothetical protein
MSKSDTAVTAAKIAGILGLGVLAGYGAYVQAEAESKMDPDALAALRARRALTDEYTFFGYRYTSEQTSYVLRVDGENDQYIEILFAADEDPVVLDTNLPGVKTGKQVRLVDARLSNDVERAIERTSTYRATDRKVSGFYMTYGQRRSPFLFEVTKKDEFVPMFLASVTDMTLSVL